MEKRVNVYHPYFGAEEFGTEGEGELRAVTEHAAHTEQKTGYFDLGTESLANFAAATTGNHDKVTGD